jgi:hypothetical protein
MARLGESPESVLEYLQLSRELFERQASFYAGYAEMLESRRSGTPGESANDAWDRIANPRQAWEGHAAIASTYRLAAQNAALVDTAWSMELATRSSLAYLDAGLAFGLFLAAGILDDQTLLRDPRRLPLLARPLTAASAAAPMSDPVQRSYLAMTLSARPQIREVLDLNVGTDRDTPLSDIIGDLGAYALQPVGPQSIPMGAYVEFADAIRSVEWSDDLEDHDFPRSPANRDRGQFQPSRDWERDGVADIGARCAAFGRGQADALRAAMRNRYLWEHGAAPVNIVDLEYVALCGNAMRRYRDASWSRAFRANVTAQLDDDPLAQIPIWVAGRMSRLIPDVAERMLALLRRGEPPANADA